MATRRLGDYVQSNILHTNHATREQERRTFQKVAEDTLDSTFFEEDPTVAGYFRDLVPTTAGAAKYVRDLFPSASWIRRYNFHWLLGDAISGEHTCREILSPSCRLI